MSVGGYSTPTAVSCILAPVYSAQPDVLAGITHPSFSGPLRYCHHHNLTHFAQDSASIRCRATVLNAGDVVIQVVAPGNNSCCSPGSDDDDDPSHLCFSVDVLDSAASAQCSSNPHSHDKVCMHVRRRLAGPNGPPPVCNDSTDCAHNASHWRCSESDYSSQTLCAVPLLPPPERLVLLGVVGGDRVAGHLRWIAFVGDGSRLLESVRTSDWTCRG